MYPHQNGWALFTEGYPANSSSPEAPSDAEAPAYQHWAHYDSSPPTYSTPTGTACLKPGYKPEDYIPTTASDRSQSPYCYIDTITPNSASPKPPEASVSSPVSPNTVEAFHRVPLGEKGRMELKAAIRAAIKDKPELRERVNGIAKLRCATIPQLLKIALICDLWTKALDISRRFVESRNGKQARQGTRRQASPKASPDAHRSRLTPRDRVMKQSQVLKRPGPAAHAEDSTQPAEWIPQPPVDTSYVGNPVAGWGPQYYETASTYADTSQDVLAQSGGLFPAQSDHFVAAPEFDTLWPTGPFVRDSIL